MAAMTAFLLLVVGLNFSMAAALPLPPGIKYLGIGYNLLTGNPDGDPNRGNIDPGLLTTRRMYQFSYSEAKESVERKFRLPDQVVYSGKRNTKYTGKTKSVFIGEKSYQTKLSREITAEGSGSYGLATFSFSFSHRSEEMRQGSSYAKNVFIEEKDIRSYGSVRLQYKTSSMTREYRSLLCNLPKTYTEWKTSGNSEDTLKYMRLFDKWGTHIVTQVQLGEKILKRFKSKSKKFTQSLMTQNDNSVSVGGGYGAFSASLSVDISNMNQNEVKTSSEDEVSETIHLGSESLPEPIHLFMVPLYRSISSLYLKKENNAQNTSMSLDAPETFGSIDNGSGDDDLLENADRLSAENCPNWKSIRRNIKTALLEYPRYRNAKIPGDPMLKIPLTWPEGRYGLPKPSTGCPTEGTWKEGWRKYDTEDDDASNSWSHPQNFAADLSRNNLKDRYCIKTHVTQDDIEWSPGSYCVYMFDNKCPTGFQPGSIYWDDEDDDNSNSYGGMVPTGGYDSNTRVSYCCRKDGSAFNSIYLPTKNNFYLLMGPASRYCQEVKRMKVSPQWIKWDTEDDDNDNSKSGSVPWSSVSNNIKINYCYYTPA